MNAILTNQEFNHSVITNSYEYPFFGVKQGYKGWLSYCFSRTPSHEGNRSLIGNFKTETNNKKVVVKKNQYSVFRLLQHKV